MTENKRFTYDKPLVAFSKGGINDNVTGEIYEFTIDTVLDLLNELHEEVMDLRGENTKFKLVVGEIIEDMQKYVDDDQLVYINQSYVDWIKQNVDVTLYSQKGD